MSDVRVRKLQEFRNIVAEKIVNMLYFIYKLHL